jgi:hypothetical protein
VDPNASRSIESVAHLIAIQDGVYERVKTGFCVEHRLTVMLSRIAAGAALGVRTAKSAGTATERGKTRQLAPTLP